MLKIDLLQTDTGSLRPFTDFFNDPKIVALKSNDSSFFLASIQKLIPYNNEIFILDDRFSNLLRFDSGGRFINNYGKIGLGLNEYSKISDFDIDTINERVVIFSNANKSLYYYSLQTGTFIKKVNIGLFGSQICVLPSEGVLLYRNFSTESKDKDKDYNILLIDSAGKITGKAFPFNSTLSFMEWRATGFLRKTNNRILFSNAFSDTVYQFQNNQFTPVVETNVLSENIKQIRDDHNKLFTSKVLLDSGSGHMGTSYFRNDNFIIFDYMQGKRIKTGIYEIDNNKLGQLSTKLKTDALTALYLTPIYLKDDNTTFFKFSKKDLLTTKKKYPSLFDKLSPSNKAIVNDTAGKSGTYLLVGKMKNF